MTLLLRVFLLLIVLAVAACASSERRHPATDTIAIVDVTVVDVVAGVLRPHRTVLLSGPRITAVVPAAGFRAPPGVTQVDGRDRFLIPGLWDMHAHALWSEQAMRSFLPAYVAHGVTGIRDMGGRLDILQRYRAAQGGADVAWPRVVAAGQVLDGPEPVQAEISIAVTDAASAIAAVDAQQRAGADFIKVYTLLGRDAYFAILTRARQLGLPVAGHVPAAVTVEEAARAGQRSIEHLRDELEPICTPAKEQACARLAALFRQQQTWQVPTMVVLRHKAFFDDPSLITDPRLAALPPGLREEWLAERAGKLARGADYLQRKRAWYADEQWLLRYLIAQRVPILAGTDAGVAFSYPGSSLHEELALLIEHGMTPLDALRSATLWPAQFLGERATMGSVAPGQVADLVLLRGNPLADIKATRQIEAVILRGRMVTDRPR